jgi:hypothetical protein
LGGGEFVNAPDISIEIVSLGDLNEEKDIAEAEAKVGSAEAEKVRGFTITGATGAEADCINGVYERLGRRFHNGSQVYIKAGSGGR